MRFIFQTVVFFAIMPLNGLTNCKCDYLNNKNQDVNFYLIDSVDVFRKSKTLKVSQESICVYEALNLEFEYYFSLKRNAKAYSSLQKQENIFKTLECKDALLGNLYLNKANYYLLINDFENLSYFGFKALHESERLNNSKLELKSLKAIIYLFMRLDRDAKNWEYVQRARDIIISMDESKDKASQYIWLAYEYETQYVETGRLSLIDSSFIYASSAKLIAKKYALNRELAQSYRANEAIAYHKGEPENALKYIDSAIYHGKITKGVFNLSPFYIAKAWDLIDLGRLNEASKCIDTSLIVDNKKDLGFSTNVWHEAKEIYGITGDTAKAYKSFKMYTKLKDSILNIERIKSANEVEAKYKSQLKDTKIKNLTFLLIIAVVVILIGFLIFNILRLRKAREKDKAINDAYKQQLVLEKEIINVRNNIAKDFHDDLGNKLAKITALSDLMTNKNKSKIELKDALNIIKNDADILYEGTRDFMFSLKSNSDYLEEIVTYLSDFGEDFFSDLEIDFYLQKKIAKNVKLPTYWNRQTILIFKEAMTNTAKHSKCTKVSLQFAQNSNNELVITLEDDGKGFDESKPYKKGLLNMQKRAHKINALLSVLSDSNGTQIKLNIKLPT